MSEVSDHQQIINLAVDYCWALDRNEWHELDRIFLVDATANLGDRRCADLQAIKDTCAAALTSLDDSQHIVSTHQVAIDGDTATARCYLHAQHIVRDAHRGPHYVVAGRYEDQCVRTADGWRIAHRDLIVMWTEGNPAMLDRA